MSLAPPELKTLQRAFHTPTGTLLPWIVENNIGADMRLGIYRNNTISNLCNALQADYPVVEKLVGTDFFRHAAKTYVADTPSLNGDINDYGDDFPRVIAGFPAAAGLPYLGDVALLERAWKESFYSADANAADCTTLAELPPERFGVLHFRLHPALRLVSSSYPILQIWCANQGDADSAADINLNAGAEWILVQRPGDCVEMSLLNHAEFDWLFALSEGRSLAEAVDAAFSVLDTFDLAPCLHRHIEQGSFVGYHFGGTK